MLLPLFSHTISAGTIPQKVSVDRRSDTLAVGNGQVSMRISPAGQYDVLWGDHARILGAGGEARLADGRLLKTSNYAQHGTDVQRIKDKFGSGVRVTLRHRSANEPELRQLFWIYDNRPEVIVRLDVLNSPGSNYLAPVVADRKVELSGAANTLFVPYDNDAYVHYRSDGDETSHEVSALYNDDSRQGLVVGSIDHDVWKSGVFFRDGLKAFGGFTSKHSFDKEPHGTVLGNEIRSPRMVLGFYSDWREGLERYGDLNALVKPRLPWGSTVPFGWNSWASAKDKLTAANARAATDFIHERLPEFRSGGTAYINLDSFWDNLKPAQRTEFVEHAHASGLKAGIYWTPFVWWGELERKVGDGKHTFRDLVLKDAKGEPLAKLDGGWPLDPTHPLVKARIDRQLAEFVKDGYDFVKFDFMTHGALEGHHYDPKVTTGTSAYSQGMKQIVDNLSPKKIGRPFFISLSIAPIFPHGYAHSRRVSCDVFANIGASEYLLNSSNYGWWTGGRLYAFNDPDHTVVHHALGDPATTEAEARTRLVASVVTGGMLLEGDDLGDPEVQKRVLGLFSNREVLDLARQGKPFRPIDGATGEKGGEGFVLAGGDSVYVAAFNFDRKEHATKRFSLARLGLSGAWSVHDLLTGQDRKAQGSLEFELAPMDCGLARLKRIP